MTVRRLLTISISCTDFRNDSISASTNLSVSFTDNPPSKGELATLGVLFGLAMARESALALEMLRLRELRLELALLVLPELKLLLVASLEDSVLEVVEVAEEKLGSSSPRSFFSLITSFAVISFRSLICSLNSSCSNHSERRSFEAACTEAVNDRAPVSMRQHSSLRSVSVKLGAMRKFAREVQVPTLRKPSIAR